jgi:hypothetical protein
VYSGEWLRKMLRAEPQGPAFMMHSKWKEHLRPYENDYQEINLEDMFLFESML